MIYALCFIIFRPLVPDTLLKNSKYSIFTQKKCCFLLSKKQANNAERIASIIDTGIRLSFSNKKSTKEWNVEAPALRRDAEVARKCLWRSPEIEEKRLFGKAVMWPNCGTKRRKLPGSREQKKREKRKETERREKSSRGRDHDLTISGRHTHTAVRRTLHAGALAYSPSYGNIPWYLGHVQT